MLLKDYPQAIAKAQRQLLELEQSIIQLRESMSIVAADIERQVIADVTLTNDAKRKAKRTELQQSDADFYKASRELKIAEEKRDSLDIDLLLLRNLFSVLKLEERKAIATLELHSSTAA